MTAMPDAIVIAINQSERYRQGTLSEGASMKPNDPESDGEYTDTEPEADATIPDDGRATTDPDVEGEYTDSDTPNEANPQDTHPRT